MEITPLIIEPIKCFAFLLTVAEYLNTHLCPYLIYTGVDTYYKKQIEVFRRCFFRDSSIRTCSDGGSNAVETIEAAPLNLLGRKKVEIHLPRNLL